ncbi:MAG: hypothetical protein AB1489_10760 [Acidobacteriota bacterium]
MNKKLLLLTGIGIGTGFGAGLMFIFDPAKGKDRRTLVRGKVTDTVAKTGEVITKTPQNIANRVSGIMGEARSSYKKIKDDKLVASVCSRIEGVVSNPKSIQIVADNGSLTLSGSIPAIEVDNLLKTVSSVRGVKTLENKLETHARADDLLGSREQLVKSVVG